MHDRIEAFLRGDCYAVVGASGDRNKFGNRVLRAYVQGGRAVFPVNPRCEQIEGLRSYPNLASVPADIHGVSVVTPPDVAQQIVRQAAERGIRHLWFQPGAEHPAAVEMAVQMGMNVIAGGPCLLVELGFREVS